MLVVTLPCATIIILLRFMSGKGAVLTPCSCGFRGGIYILPPFGTFYMCGTLIPVSYRYISFV